LDNGRKAKELEHNRGPSEVEEEAEAGRLRRREVEVGGGGLYEVEEEVVGGCTCAADSQATAAGASRSEGMSIPREVLPGQTYMLTRRCTQRQYLMRPDPETNNAFIYCLAVAATRYRIQVLFTMAMSNHHHTGIHDPDGNYPAFLEHFHKLFAKCQNALRGRWENFWSSEQTSVVRLAEPSDVLDKLTYALTNPVKDGLVERAHHWPGVTSLDPTLRGTTLSASKPKHFFREDGPMPETISLSISRPPGFERLAPAEFAELVAMRVRQVEDTVLAERRRTGARVLGRRAILAQRCTDRPGSHEPRRGLSPQVAARSRWSRIEALLRNKTFRAAYAAARTAFISGVRDVLFPCGTYWLRRFANATCVAT
jgi:putative transposase